MVVVAEAALRWSFSIKVFLDYVAKLLEKTHALQLYWNQTSVWMFSFKFAAYFQNIFS